MFATKVIHLWAVSRRHRLLGGLVSLGFALIVLLTDGSHWSQPGSPYPAQPQPNAAPSLTQDVGYTVLENGLTVLTKEVHKAPVVTVQVWYRVGSRNETPDSNGISHQVEHLTFRGTRDRPVQFAQLLAAIGSQSNALTSYDYTAYYATVDRKQLKNLLILEADRMQNVQMQRDRLDSEKPIVISELQGNQDNPRYRLRQAVMQAAFPNEMYSLPPGGTIETINHLTVNQVQDYYQTYYTPQNATLVIVGDFQTAATRQAVQEIFGKIPPRGEPTDALKRSKSHSNLPSKSAPVVLQEPSKVSLLRVIYPLPPVTHADIPMLEVMQSILSEGHTSRLYRALVEPGLASEVQGFTSHWMEAGWYQIYATANPQYSPEQLAQVLQTEITRLQTQGVTLEELNRAKAQLRSRLLLQNRDITQLAMQLGKDQTLTEDYAYSDRLLANIERVRVQDIQQVARQYLSLSHQVVGFLEAQAESHSRNTMLSEMATPEQFTASVMSTPAVIQKYLPQTTLPETPLQPKLPEKITLSNGMRVLLLKDASTPTVTLKGYLSAGTQFDPSDRAGVASLTANTLMKGTLHHDEFSLAEALEDRGANLTFNVGREGVTLSANSLASDLDFLIATVAEVLQTPRFPVKQVEHSRQQALTNLQEKLDDPYYLARRTLQQTLYPQSHPFYGFPTEASLQGLTRKDIIAFYNAHYRPDNTVIAIVGDFDPKRLRQLLKHHFSGWRVPGKPPQLDFLADTPPKTGNFLYPAPPNLQQAITYFGTRGIKRQDSDYYAAVVLNEILGGDPLASRLGQELRDRLGLTYGVYSSLQAGVNPGPFLIEMQTAPQHTKKAIETTLGILTQLRDRGVSEAEVEAAKQAISSRYPVNLADPDYLVNSILLNEVYGFSPLELQDFSPKIRQVTTEKVTQAAQKLLDPANLVILTYSPS